MEQDESLLVKRMEMERRTSFREKNASILSNFVDEQQRQEQEMRRILRFLDTNTLSSEMTKYSQGFSLVLESLL